MKEEKKGPWGLSGGCPQDETTLGACPQHLLLFEKLCKGHRRTQLTFNKPSSSGHACSGDA
eukprot:1160451-Pelagomonas_calceolata.AAC.25